MFKALVKRSAILSLSVALAGGGVTFAAQNGLHYQTPTHDIHVTTSDTPEPEPWVLRMSSASASAKPSRVAQNAAIRAAGGIPPCHNEDGSGQPGMCVWDGSKRGNGTGDTVVNVPTRPGQDKRPVILVNR